LDLRNSNVKPSKNEEAKGVCDFFWKSISNAKDLKYKKLKYAGVGIDGINNVLTNIVLPWLLKNNFCWPKEKPLTCHSFRAGVETYLLNTIKMDRFFVARQGCWAINELAGELLLRYDRNQEVASRIVCEALNKALLYDSVNFSEIKPAEEILVENVAKPEETVAKPEEIHKEVSFVKDDSNFEGKVVEIMKKHMNVMESFMNYMIRNK
jgi:hypothetical protein